APFKIGETLLKLRAACAQTISTILATENLVRRVGNGFLDDVRHIRVETFAAAKRISGTAQHYWAPTDRETADHSIPYVGAAAPTDGPVGPSQFDEAHLHDPRLRALVQTVEVVEEAAFTKAYEARPAKQYTRVTVRTSSGGDLIGESGGDQGD